MSSLNRIYFGPAGTGKTREAITEAEKVVNSSPVFKGMLLSEEESFKEFSQSFDNHDDYEHLSKKAFDHKKNIYPLIDFVTFHPSYSYQDFIEGLRPTKSGSFEVVDGVFKNIVDRALKNSEYNYVLIIDEINRGDISSIFGEFFTLLEDSRRADQKEAIEITLPYSRDKKLKVPSNLYIFGTMNTVDKSIALLDIALRRRFDFIEVLPKPQLLDDVNGVSLSELLKILNQRISILKSENYQIGHSLFLNLSSFDEVKSVIVKKVIPLLQEYFYDDWQSICAVLNQSFENDGEILERVETTSDLFKSEFSELIEFKNGAYFRVNSSFSAEDLKRVYE